MFAVCQDIPQSGFSFDNCFRNELLEKKGFVAPKPIKTGTTIVAITYKDGVILGADTRATEDTIVADKNCEKIHYLAPNIYCCGAGTAADTEQTTKMISSQLTLHSLITNRPPRVCTAAQMLKQYLFRHMGYIGAALTLGGVDSTGPHVFQIYPHGSTDRLPYCTMGSGSLAAMAVFEAGWKPDLSEEEGKLLVKNAIYGGIFNDLGSGSNVDLCVVRKDSADYLRTYDEANKKGVKEGSYKFPKGTTEVVTVKEIIVKPLQEEKKVEQMDES